MIPIDPTMTREQIKAAFEDLTAEEKEQLLKAAFSALDRLSFDLLSAHQLAKRNGRAMPNEDDLQTALGRSEQLPSLH